ncbi:MAG: site-2 protease family protein [Polyangiaceae bacterium]|nr:site-2 protease family protein [Polyangiaceae bacterium]
MTWSLRVARVRGIDIRVHATFLLVVTYFVIAGYRHGPIGAAFGGALVVLIFASVTLHELGHSLVAQALGVPVREIVLLPIGGVARLGREPRTPLHELLIAVAGPAVNVLLAVGLAALGVSVFGPAWLTELELLEAMEGQPSASGLVANLLVSNVLLGVFNMLPALPMDGGRVFRATLAMFTTRERATNVAATVGQVLAASMGIFALLKGNFVLALIGGFVFLAAGQERYAVNSRVVLQHLRAGEVVNPNAVVLEPSHLLGDVLDWVLQTGQSHFAVIAGGRLLGVASRDGVLAAVRRTGLGAPVTQALEPVPVVPAQLTLEELRAALVETGASAVAVEDADGFAGLVTADDLARVASVATALERMGIRRELPPPRA